jgi:putative MATE family efflux protein
MSNSSPTINLQVTTSHQQILKIALPISLAIMVPQLNFITNNIFLGGLGQEALGIAGITGVYYLIFAVVGHGLNNGLQALISRRAGENRVDEIGRLFTQGIYISFGFAALGILFTWFVAPIILKFSLHDPVRVAIAVRFLNIRILGLPFLYVYQMRNALLVGTNQTRYLILGTTTEAVVNVFFDYTLIYGKLGLPQMGFDGAAIASIISEVAGLVVLFLVLRYKGISKQLNLFKSWKFERTNSKLIIIQSAPLIAQHAISIISWEFFYILIEHHGARDLAVSNTMRNMFGFFGCFTWAFAATANTMVSNVIGQNKQELVMPLIKKIMYWSVGFASLVCLILNLYPHAFLSVYGQGEDFIQSGIPVLRVVSCALVLMSISVVWMNAVTGSGNSSMNLATEFIAILFYCIYVYTTMEKMQLPITWGWGSEWIYWTTILIPSFWYMQSGKWKKIKI